MLFDSQFFTPPASPSSCAKVMPSDEVECVTLNSSSDLDCLSPGCLTPPLSPLPASLDLENESFCINPKLLVFSEESQYLDFEEVDVDVVTVDQDFANTSLPQNAQLLLSEARRLNFSPSSTYRAPKRNKSRNATPYERRQLSEQMDDVERRQMHNILERRRREDLKAIFESLALAIPELKSEAAKASKAQILSHAKEIIIREREMQARLFKLRDQALVENARLSARLSSLQAKMS